MLKHKLSETCGMFSNLRNFVGATTIDWKCTGQGINFMNKVKLVEISRSMCSYPNGAINCGVPVRVAATCHINPLLLVYRQSQLGTLPLT